MALSGSVDFSLTAREVIKFALRKCGKLAAGQSVDADIAENARIDLNMMLKDWQKYDVLWLKKEGSQTLTANTASYSLSTNPRRLYSARFRQTVNSQARDIPMINLERDEYFDLPVKDATGIPTQYYFDPQQSAGTLYVWPLLSSISATAETIEYTYQSRIDDIDDLSDDLDIRQEYFATVGWGLAEYFLPGSGIKGERAARIEMMSQRLQQSMIDDSRPDFLQISPNERR